MDLNKEPTIKLRNWKKSFPNHFATDKSLQTQTIKCCVFSWFPAFVASLYSTALYVLTEDNASPKRIVNYLSLISCPKTLESLVQITELRSQTVVA